jgi:hypothetical protein
LRFLFITIDIKISDIGNIGFSSPTNRLHAALPANAGGKKMKYATPRVAFSLTPYMLQYSWQPRFPKNPLFEKNSAYESPSSTIGDLYIP